MLNIIEPEISSETSHADSVSYEILSTFLKYINKKNNKVCYHNITSTVITIDISSDDYKIILPSFSKNSILNCLDNKRTDIILVPITLYQGPNKMSHFNVIIINKLLKRLEYFEPYGTLENYKQNYEKIEHFICGEFIKLLNNKDYKKCMIPGRLCPFGLQKHHEYELMYNKEGPRTEKNSYFGKFGLCVGWCILIMHLTVLNPTSKTREIVDYLIKTYKGNLDLYIRRYIKYLEEYKIEDERQHNEWLDNLLKI